MKPLCILYQDDTLVAIDKPVGMIVHPGREPEGPEWIAMKRLRDQLGQLVFPVHRLDRPTSGVLLFALDRATSTLVQQSFELRQVEKSYLAIVCGITELSWRCDLPLQKNSEEPLLAAETAFDRLDVIEAFMGRADLSFSLLQARPVTGRFHQIRRHLLESGFPIVGDYRYAGRERSDELGDIFGTGTRMLLQAKVLEMRHPHTGESLRIESPADPDFMRFFPSQAG
jgi:tRNA pseudouridine65 synthase